MTRLTGKVAFITGGASGIGRACAVRFAEEGADVVVADLQPDGGGETVRLVEEHGRRAVFVPMDSSREDEVDEAVAQGVAALGRVDLCVAAAGISGGGPRLDATARMIVDKPTEYWRRVIDVNLTGVMLTNRAVARRMIAQGDGGKIVNIASGAAKIPLPGAADYSVSKAGVWMLTKVLALEFAPYKIRVNAIGPGVIETPMTAELLEDEARVTQLTRRTPLGRVGQPVDIANCALFLCSDESDYFTGQILHPDGGLFTG